jgi:hypothetical protein
VLSAESPSLGQRHPSPEQLSCPAAVAGIPVTAVSEPVEQIPQSITRHQLTQAWNHRVDFRREDWQPVIGRHAFRSCLSLTTRRFGDRQAGTRHAARWFARPANSILIESTSGRLPLRTNRSPGIALFGSVRVEFRPSSQLLVPLNPWRRSFRARHRDRRFMLVDRVENNALYRNEPCATARTPLEASRGCLCSSSVTGSRCSPPRHRLTAAFSSG